MSIPSSDQTPQPELFHEPFPQHLASSQFTQFISHVNRHQLAGPGRVLKDYWDLHEWSVEVGEGGDRFWKAVWDFTGLMGDIDGDVLFDNTKPMFPPYPLLPTAHLNFAENCLLAHSNARSKSNQAIISCVEPSSSNKTSNSKTQTLRKLTWSELYDETLYVSEHLKAIGIRPGDVVVGLGPNNAEMIVGLLATTAIGAVWSSCPTEFGEKAILDRFEQIQPRVLITVDRVRYAGKETDVYPKLLQVLSSLPTITHVVITGHLNESRSPTTLPRVQASNVIVEKPLPLLEFWTWPEFADNGKRIARGLKKKMEIDFWRGPAMAPVFILYSSGTTGKPKAIIHSIGGMVLAAKLNGICQNVGSKDMNLQFTTIGWMMWNLMCGLLSNGVGTIAYDGSPLVYPSILWDIVEEHRVTSLSISPRYLQGLQASGYKPRLNHNLRHLHGMFTAGSPLKPESYDYVRDWVGDHVFVSNGSGGTDICGAFVGPCHILPVYKGEIQVPLLGMKMDSWDDEGRSVRDASGNMVCIRPFPNMPLGFVGDENNERYRSTYFDTYKEIVWNHSDWITINSKTNGITIWGRSDGVLNPGGVRFGSGEIYNIVEKVKDVIEDSIAVGQKLPETGDERVILFVKTVGDRPLDKISLDRIKATIVAGLSRRHVPECFVQVPAIPYNSSMKKLEIAVKKLTNGVPLEKINVATCENPECLKHYIDRPEIRLEPPRVKAKL